MKSYFSSFHNYDFHFLKIKGRNESFFMYNLQKNNCHISENSQIFNPRVHYTPNITYFVIDKFHINIIIFF